MMRVTVDEDVTVCPDGHLLTFRAGQTVEGPVATYLAESGCAVTVETDDRPAAPRKGRKAAGQAAADG